MITSTDGVKWEPAVLITSKNSDLRDPKITVTPDGQLMLYAAEALHDRSRYSHQSLVWFSRDGRTWSDRHPIGDPDFWIWRITWHNGVAYDIGYGCANDLSIRLYTSKDGKKFSTLVERLYDKGYPNETALVFSGDTAYCLVRRDGERGENSGLIGIAQPPYTKWEWKDLIVPIGGPQMIELSDSRFFAAVRLYDKKVRTSLCGIDRKDGKLTEFLPLPTGGDTSWIPVWGAARSAGTAFKEGRNWSAAGFTVIATLDVFLVRSILKGDGKLLFGGLIRKEAATVVTRESEDAALRALAETEVKSLSFRTHLAVQNVLSGVTSGFGLWAEWRWIRQADMLAALQQKRFVRGGLLAARADPVANGGYRVVSLLPSSRIPTLWVRETMQHELLHIAQFLRSPTLIAKELTALSTTATTGYKARAQSLASLSTNRTHR